MRLLTLLICAGIALGCAGQNSQLATCQAEKEQLLTTIRSQRDTTRALHDQVASLETRLDQAEKVLARGDSGTRISTRPSESPPLPAKNESLPWRAPAAKAPKLSAAEVTEKRGPQLVTSPAPVPRGTKLKELAERDRRLQYDRAARAARVELPIGFRDQSATLTGEDKRRLDELSQLLKGDDARDLKVVVAGSAANEELGKERARAVTDYLDRHGIARERLAVSGAASGGRVEVYLLEADVSVAGFVPPGRQRR